MTKSLNLFSKLIAVVFAGLILASTASADPLTFSNVVALQDEGFTSVDLFSNPGVNLIGPEISFKVDITGTLPPGGVDTLFITYAEANSPAITQSFDIPFFGSVQPPFTVLFTFTSPGANSVPLPATLTIDLLNSSPDFVVPGGPKAGQAVDSYSYQFNVSTPVPEPASLALAGLGMTALATRLRRRRREAKNRID